MRLERLFKTWRVVGSNLVAELFGGLIVPTVQQRVATITYSASMTPDFLAGNVQVITVTDAVAWTLNAPSNPPSGTGIGALLTIVIRNASGGVMGATTFDAVYKMAALTDPANGFSKSLTFMWNGTNWVEISRTPNDVPN